ncbi:AAA family ATPase [Acinetobacter tianfuensis]|uniref:ATPase n=1 Tax=Acinetobacter tianfuensis TaxID=2419603 RepID=A0A3A8E3R9_9GAMM|nr:AAA family ATPase [Acinetobacter tianfuensis]RKG29315.1 hypothetical protein D7V32_15530 [Acinetobacter tianfuensis]
MKTRIHTLISAISDQMYERQHIIALSLLAGAAGMNTFLYGQPGTAKSLISRRIASAFEVSEYFEYLMNRFSTPEEIFGPVSIKALKEDQYIRKTEHYLPRADFAFLDEIWKASPAILNTLLTLVNEKTFKNGDLIQQVPLKVLMSASNEIPEPDQGLDALYDRFIMRLVVAPIAQAHHFHALLQSKPAQAKLDIDSSLKIKKQELQDWRMQMHEVQLPERVLAVFDDIRLRLKHSFEDHQIYVSDRRWQRAAYLLKAAAFLDQREQVLLADLHILKHCLWSQIEEISWLEQAVNDAVDEAGLLFNSQLEALIQEKEQLEQQILNVFYYTDDVYESYVIGEKEYLRAVTNLDQYYKDKPMYLELNKMGTKQDFFAADAAGEEVRGIVCNYNGTRLCTLKGGYYGLEEAVSPYIKHPKGSRRAQVSAAQTEELKQSVLDLKARIEADYVQQKLRFQHEAAAFESAFVEQADIQRTQLQMTQRLERFALQQQDCLRLEQLCQS